MKGRQLSFRSQLNICRHRKLPEIVWMLWGCAVDAQLMKIMMLHAQLLLLDSENVNIIEGVCAVGREGLVAKQTCARRRQQIQVWIASHWFSVLSPSNPGSFCTSFHPDFQQGYCGELKSLAQVVSVISMLFNNGNIYIYAYIICIHSTIEQYSIIEQNIILYICDNRNIILLYICASVHIFLSWHIRISTFVKVSNFLLSVQLLLTKIIKYFIIFLIMINVLQNCLLTNPMSLTRRIWVITNFRNRSLSALSNI